MRKFLAALFAVLISFVEPNPFPGVASAVAADEPIYPVVLIPGILGSKLCKDDNGEAVWGASAAGSLRNFALLDLSVANTVKLHSCGIVSQVQVLGPLYSVDAYRVLLEALQTWGLKQGKNLFIFDYDWRKSNAETAKALEKFVAAHIKQGERFNIVAHSMGGLAVRLYLARTTAGARPFKVIYLGTPFLGSANTLGTLSVGWGTMPNWLAGGEDTIRRVALSFPSLLELLPRYKECCSLKIAPNQYRPIDVFDANQWRINGWLPSQMQNGRGFAKFSDDLRAAQAMSPVLAAPVPDAIEVKFAGNSKDTRFIFAVEQGHTIPNNNNWKFSFERGDGTVPVWSAASDATLSNLAGSLQSFSEHSTIFDDQWVLEELKRELFTNKAVIDRPIAGAGSPVITVVVGGQQQEWSLKGVRIEPSATYIQQNQELHISVLLSFDGSAKDFQTGIYRPRVMLIQGTSSTEMTVTDVSSKNDAANMRLSFEADKGVGALKPGIAEIRLELPNASSRPRLSEYVVVME